MQGYRANIIVSILVAGGMLPGQMAPASDVTKDAERGLLAFQRGDLATARNAFAAVIARGPAIGPLFGDVSMCLALLDARVGRTDDALRRLGEINRVRPTADGLLFEMALANDQPGGADRAASVARRFSLSLRERAASDPVAAKRMLFRALEGHLDPELIAKVTFVAANVAGRSIPMPEVIPGAGFESLQNAARLTRSAAMAIQNSRWSEAARALHSAIVDADSAKDGHPRQAFIVLPMLHGAAAASYALDGKMEEAQFHAGEAIRKSQAQVQRDNARQLANVLSSLRRSRLDRSAAESLARATDGAAAAQSAADAGRAAMFAQMITSNFTFR